MPDPRFNPKEFVTIDEAAAAKGCSVTTLWRRAREGELELHRLFGRTLIRREDLDAITIGKASA